MWRKWVEIIMVRTDHLLKVMATQAPKSIYQEHSTSIHKELHLEACQVPARGICQAVSTQVQGGQVLQVEQLGIQFFKIVVAQVHH